MLKFLSGLVVGAVLTFVGLHYHRQGSFELGMDTYPVGDAIDTESLWASAREYLRNVLEKLPDAGNFTSDGSVELLKVVDGDSIEVRLNGEHERIRYIGANTPEYDDPCFNEAKRANEALLRSGPLSLDTDETDRDRYGRLLRYVYAGDVLVERELIRNGWAEVVRYRSDDRHYQAFRELEVAAARQGLGCHPTGIFEDGSLTR